MPLLCISLLALLFLPQFLSCDSKRLPEEVRNDYMVVVQTDLDNTRENITASLHNSSCREPEDNLPSCTLSHTVDVLRTLHRLACRMKRLRLSQTDGLTTSVLNSIRCPCREERNKEHNGKRSKAAPRPRRNEQKQNRETTKLCKAKTILSNMTECYEMLNAQLMDT